MAVVVFDTRFSIICSVCHFMAVYLMNLNCVLACRAQPWPLGGAADWSFIDAPFTVILGWCRTKSDKYLLLSFQRMMATFVGNKNNVFHYQIWLKKRLVKAENSDRMLFASPLLLSPSKLSWPVVASRLQLSAHVFPVLLRPALLLPSLRQRLLTVWSQSSRSFIFRISAPGPLCRSVARLTLWCHTHCAGEKKNLCFPTCLNRVWSPQDTEALARFK